MKKNDFFEILTTELQGAGQLLPEIFLLVSVLLLTLYLSFGVGRYMHNYFFRVSFSFILLFLFLAFLLSVYNASFFNLILNFYEVRYEIAVRSVFILNNYLAFDTYVLFFRSFTILASFACCLISLSYFKTSAFRSFEYPLIIVLSVIGSLLLISSIDLMPFYLTMEFTSFCLYTLAASRYNSVYSVEAGIKYFVQGCAASAFYLFGSALFFLLAGNTNFFYIKGNIAGFFDSLMLGKNLDLLEIFIFSYAMGFVLILPFFKVAIAPFHYWIADVYEGSPLPITAYFSIVVKLTMAAVLIRFLFNVFDYAIILLNYIFLVLGVLSVIIGSFAALMEQKIKRVLAFSSIAHSGYILLALLPCTPNAISVSLNYLLVYVITNVIIFSFLLLCASIKQDVENRYLVYVSDLGLLQRNSYLLSACFSIALLSFAGIPPFGGFFVKFGIFSELWNSGYIITVILLVLINLVSTFYYLRFVKCLFFSPNTKGIYLVQSSVLNTLIIVILVFLLIFYPLFFDYINTYVNSLDPHCDFSILGKKPKKEFF